MSFRSAGAVTFFSRSYGYDFKKCLVHDQNPLLANSNR